MRLLFVEQAVPKAVVTSWVRSQHRELEREATQELADLAVWTEETSQGGMPAWKMDQEFKKNLRNALLGGYGIYHVFFLSRKVVWSFEHFSGESWLMQPMTEPDPNRRDIAYLDQYAQDRWNTVLHYMVGSSHQEGISADAVNILLKSGLIVLSGEGDGAGAPAITRAGFQFLLMDTPSQVWYFILQYLDSVEERNMELSECLNFLFQLSFATLGQVRRPEPSG